MRDMALVQSAESSNRIEGVTVQPDRLKPLVLGNVRPKNRSEEEVQGYRKALNLIHTNHAELSITPKLLEKLHFIIQEVMGWENYHLYDFNINKARITIPDSDWDNPEKIMDSKKTKVKDLVLKQKFFYTYDFGDCWEHTILVEKILPKGI